MVRNDSGKIREPSFNGKSCQRIIDKGEELVEKYDTHSRKGFFANYFKYLKICLQKLKEREECPDIHSLGHICTSSCLRVQRISSKTWDLLQFDLDQCCMGVDVKVPFLLSLFAHHGQWSSCRSCQDCGCHIAIFPTIFRVGARETLKNVSPVPKRRLCLKETSICVPQQEILGDANITDSIVSA